MKPAIRTPRAPSRGFSLIELMVAIAIGMLMLAGLVSVFAASMSAHQELQKFAQQIENGRYALEQVSTDLRHAGFYGQFYNLPSPPAAAPDPCETASANNLYAALPLSVQVYSAADFATRADLSATTCAAWGLTSANLVPGTDVLVVRRAEASSLAATDVPAAADVYIQATSLTAEIQFGNAAGAIGTTNKADGTAAGLFRKDGSTAAEIRKYHVHIYFIAPCSIPAGGGATCTGAADDSGRPIPTLKRLELSATAGVTIMSIVQLAEGIDNLQVEFGIDDTPVAVNDMTGFAGDGTPDRFAAAPPLSDLPNVVSATVYVLARNTEPSASYTDTKTYSFGLAGAPAATNDNYRRHLFNAQVRLINPSGRREIPQ